MRSPLLLKCHWGLEPEERNFMQMQIVTGKTPEELVTRVNEDVAEGWVFTGPPFVFCLHGEQILCWAMGIEDAVKGIDDLDTPVISD
jgi:hypothetical protein